MGFRFRKRIKLLPGLWLNLSKSGVSTSIGGKGLTVNIKGGKTKTTAGIPGTGLSYSESSTNTSSQMKPERKGTSVWIWLLIIFIFGIVVIWTTNLTK